MDRDTGIGGSEGRFPQTRRTIVGALQSDDAAERRRAFETLVALYWKPLYKYLRIKWRKSNEDAKDAVQGFFAMLLERDALASYDSDKAAFRTFLRLLFDRWLANEAKAATRIKRGGTVLEVDFESAEVEIRRQGDDSLEQDEYLHREWLRSLFGLAVDRLREELSSEGRELWFRIFESYDLDPPGGERPTYRRLAETHGIPETSVTNHLAAARRRFRQIALDLLRESTATDEELRTEARAIFGVAP
ncbi:MAG TPA: hypothetical protein VMT00_17090 [Thermoanaerobaculia bacterium]|nr:hypothetical protein [Thermoanaerobaculia bacterium]